MMRRAWWTALVLTVANGATVEADYAAALRLKNAGDTTGALAVLERIVAARPGFSRAWQSIAEWTANGPQAGPVAARPEPAACLGRIRLLKLQNAAESAIETEARLCAGRLPDSFSVYAVWLNQMPESRWPALRAEFTARAKQNPTAPALAFASALAAQLSPDAEARRWLASVDRRGLSVDNLNDLDDLAYFISADAAERQAAVVRLMERARVSGDTHWLYRAAGRQASLARAAQRWTEALAAAREARAGAIELGRPAALFAGIEGECLYRLGRPREAIDAFQASLAAAEREKDRLREAQAAGWIADQLNVVGRFTEAIGYARRALDLSRALKNQEITADQQINLAFSWTALGQGPVALAALEEARTLVVAPARGWHGRILNDAADLYLQLGRPREARECADRSLATQALDELRRAEAHLVRAEAARSLGETMAADLAAAAELAPGVPNYTARRLLLLGRYREAAAAAAGFPRIQLEAAIAGAKVLELQKRPLEALAMRKQAISLAEQVRLLLAVDHRAGYLAPLAAELYRGTVRLLLTMGRAEEAFAVSERGRARALLDASSAAPVRVVGPESRAAAQLRQTTVRIRQARTVADRRQAEISLQSALDAYLISLRAKAAPGEAAVLTANAIQQRLPPGALLLHYDLDNGLFVLGKRGLRHFRLEPRAVLEKEARAARLLLASPPERVTQNRLLGHLNRLHELLLQPAANELRQARELWIVPDGALHSLPMEALVARPATAFDSAEYLVRQVSVRYVPSATLALTRRPVAAGPRLDLVAFGDPPGPSGASAFRDGAWTRLPYSREEVETVGALYSRSRLYLGAAAHEGAFKSSPDLAQARIVHVAAHGMVDDRWPLMSGLLLGGPPGEDGVLRAYEIQALTLRAGLVILSACDSGTGAEVAGEGVASLRYSFLSAGARSIAASLWPVNDRAAAELMVAFHRHLRQPGRTPGQALRAAQLEQLTGARAHPHFWSVFTWFSAAAE